MLVRITYIALAVWTMVILACQGELSHNLDETAANRVVTTLAEHGIAAQVLPSRGSPRDEPSFTVVVPTSELSRARRILMERELPTSPEPGLAEVFDRSGLVPTPVEERASLVRAIQGELVRTIESLDGVVAARVHVSLADSQRGVLPDDGEATEASASILLRYSSTEPPLTEDQIRGLVAGAVAGLKKERVTVVSIPQATSSTPNCEIVPLGPFSVAYGSLNLLRFVLVTASVLCGLLGCALFFLVLRLRTLRRRLLLQE